MSRLDHPTPSFDYTIAGHELWTWRQQALQEAIAHNIPASEVDWFLQALTPLTRLDLRLETFKVSPLVQLSVSGNELKSRWSQRVTERIPLQYLVGHTQWRDFQMTVSPAVLIPRPETELLIDLAITATEARPALRQGHWVDLGTGSGAIALGLAAAFPDATVHGVDCSEAALAIAHQNIQNNSNSPLHRHHSPLHKRIHLHQGSWFSPWAFDGCYKSKAGLSSSHLPMQFSGIVSNPPYIPSDMVLELQPEVVRHEPHLALDGGTDGLDCLRDLIDQASTYLAPNGIFLLEMMAGQAETVAHLINCHGNYHSTEIHADLAGIDRFVLTRNTPTAL